MDNRLNYIWILALGLICSAYNKYYFWLIGYLALGISIVVYNEVQLKEYREKRLRGEKQ
jgi:hypothetical protein